MGTLSEGATKEILERHQEALDKMGGMMLNNGFNDDGINVINDLIRKIYDDAKTDNCRMWGDDELLIELRKIGVDKWSREAKDRMYESGLKTITDLNRAFNIALECGVIRGQREDKEDNTLIYEGW